MAGNEAKGYWHYHSFSQNNYLDDWYKAAEATHHMLGGKSSVVGSLPIAMVYGDELKIKEWSVRQSKND